MEVFERKGLSRNWRDSVVENIKISGIDHTFIFWGRVHSLKDPIATEQIIIKKLLDDPHEIEEDFARGSWYKTYKLYTIPIVLTFSMEWPLHILEFLLIFQSFLMNSLEPKLISKGFYLKEAVS